MKAKPEHEIAYQELAALINRHAGKLTAVEILAVAANMLGKLIAMQDLKTVTPEMAIKIVSRNIELGNQQVLEQLNATKGNA